jgi:hypothetical protein
MENHPQSCEGGSMKGRRLERSAALPEKGGYALWEVGETHVSIKKVNAVLNISK